VINLKKCSKLKADCAEYISSIFCHAIINAVGTRIKIQVLKVIV
jgi:Na+/serine symporter